MRNRRTGYAGVRLLFVVLTCCCLVGLSACSTYVTQSTQIRQSLLAGDYPGALDLVEKIDQSRSRLLYLYEKGLILHYEDEYRASNEALEQADFLLEELYTKSVTRELAALALTDNITKYRGDPFEAVLVHYYKILNYLHLGDMEGAEVECRRVNHKLQILIDSGETYFTNDPFLQYLTAMVYDAAGDEGEAEVSYRTAVSAFDELAGEYGIETPSLLFCDAAANARWLGDAEEAERYAAAATDCGARRRAEGTVNVFLECGYVPHKREENLVLPVYEDDDDEDKDKFAATLASRRGAPRRRNVKVDYLLRVAMPVLVPTPAPFDYALIRPVPPDSVELETNARARTKRVENLATLATRAFEEKKGKILLRTIIRALTKYAAKKSADKKGEGLGLVVNILNVATESADTRSWSTLPEKILMGRVTLPPGTYDLDVELYDPAGHPTDRFRIRDVIVRAGRTTFLNYRVY